MVGQRPGTKEGENEVIPGVAANSGSERKGVAAGREWHGAFAGAFVSGIYSRRDRHSRPGIWGMKSAPGN